MTRDDMDAVIGSVIRVECGLNDDTPPLILSLYQAIFIAAMRTTANLPAVGDDRDEILYAAKQLEDAS